MSNPGSSICRNRSFRVDDAREFVEAPFADGIAVVGLPVDLFADLFRRHRGVDPYQFAAKGHDRLDRPVAQRKYAAHDLLLYLLHFAVLRAFLDDGAYLLLGDLRIRFAEPQQAGHACGAARQEPYERRGQQREQAHGPCCQLGDLFRRVHADAFGHELPEYEGQVGYDDDDRDLRHDRGRAQGNAECGELPAEFRGQRIARVDTREDAYQRDADLDGRKEFVRVFDKLLRLPRPGVALPCLHLQIGAARRDHGDLRHGEEAVQDD